MNDSPFTANHSPSSAAVAKAVAEEVVQIRDVVNLLDGGVDVVFHAAKTQLVAV